MDTLAMTTDQKVGCSSHPERAEKPQVRGIEARPLSGSGGVGSIIDGQTFGEGLASSTKPLVVMYSLRW